MNIIDIGLKHYIDVDNIDTKNINIIIDAGVCVDIIDSSYFPAFTLWGFEPSKKNYDALISKKINVPDGSSLHLLNSALGGENSQPKMTLIEVINNRYKEWANICGLYRNKFKASDIVEYEVDVVNANSFIKDLPRVDYFKMDIEGAEIDVLRTMTTENFKKIRQLSFEFHGNQSEKNEIKKILSQHFSFVDMNPEKNNDNIVQGEIFCQNI